MGSPVQEILQGRGDKERTGFRLIRGLPLLCLLLAWLGLQSDFPLTYPVSWFSFAGSVFVILTIIHFVWGKWSFEVETILSLLIVITGAMHALHQPWLRPLYFPVLVSLAALFRLRPVVIASGLIPFLELGSFFRSSQRMENLAFFVFLALTSILSSFIFSRLRRGKEDAVASLTQIKTQARDITTDTGMETLGSEEVASHYFASMLKTDEEIREVLGTVRQAVFADSAALFVPGPDTIRLRCATDEYGDVSVTRQGALATCMREKKSFYSGDVEGKKSDIGYVKGGKISSALIVPVMDSSIITGLLTVETARYQAFSDMEQNTVKMFAAHISRILQRERIYLMIKRDIFGLRVLKDESSNLVTSLNSDVIAAKLCEGAEKIAHSRVFFFMSDQGGFSLRYSNAAMPQDRRVFDLSGTFLNMAAENKQPLYVSDAANYRVPVLPFKTGPVHGVLAVPLVYESSLLGIFAMLMDEENALDTFQVDMLKVMCNQASISIANARLHAEIEKMATTDGLTGLYNHRHFQERLDAEMKRTVRFPEPLSLMLTDIDHFKKINDTYGHPVGDVVLKGVSGLIRDSIREVDLPARYGGEEFAVILPGTGAEGAQKIAERLRNAVMSRIFSGDERQFKVTISIGIAASPDDASTKEELIEKADQALYHAKHNGRNQSVLWRSLK